MKNNAIKNIKNLIKKQDIAKLLIIFKESNFHELIKELKYNEIFIDRRGFNKNSDLINQLENAFNSYEELVNYFTEVKLINNIFVEIKNLQYELNNDIPAKFILPIFNNLLIGYVKSFNDEKNLKKLKNENHDSIITYEFNLDLYNNCFKSFCYNDLIYKNNAFLYYPRIGCIRSYFCRKYYELIENYIENSIFSNIFEDSFLWWKNNLASIQIKGDKIEIRATNKQKILYNCLCNTKEKLYQNYVESFSLIKGGHNRNLFKLYKDASIEILQNYFFDNIANICIQEIPLIEWLNTYSCLMKLCQSLYKKAKNDSFSLLTSKYIPIKTKKYWHDFLEKNNISNKNVTKIFEYLTFSQNSTDVYDYPFIKVKNKYFLNVAILKDMMPAKAIISRFSRNDVNIDFKGKNFEVYLKNILNQIKIPCVNLHNKINGEEYECDLVFFLNNTLVFCECKHRNQYKPHEYNYNDYKEDFNQIERITDFYVKHLNLVQDTFMKNGYDLKIKKPHIKKLVIYSRAVDGIIKENKIIGLDFVKFITPFKRGKIQKFIPENLQYIFSGDVSIDKIFKYYENDYDFYQYKNKFVFKIEEYSLGGYKISNEIIENNEIFSEDLNIKQFEFFDSILRN